jgi:acyl-CoA synthetase (AMP-forming)/AMP-acid ligase II
VAFVVPRTDCSPSVAELRKFLLENAASYQQPRFVWIVDRLPISTTSKFNARMTSTSAIS